MSEERKKKSGAAWKAEEDEKLNKSRAFLELTKYIANAVDNDTHFSVYLPNFTLSCICYIQRHTLCSPTMMSVLQARLVPQSTTCCFSFLVCFF